MVIIIIITKFIFITINYIISLIIVKVKLIKIFKNFINTKYPNFFIINQLSNFTMIIITIITTITTIIVTLI